MRDFRKWFRVERLRHKANALLHPMPYTFNLYNMRRTLFFFATVTLIAFSSCKKEIIQQTKYDNVIYEVDPVKLYQSNAEKNKQKSSVQYISILHSDLFNQSISSKDLNGQAEATLSLGDKGIANEMILYNLLNKPGVQIPTVSEMKSNVDQFIINTYQRFYLRNPTEYEKFYFRNLINTDATVTPQVIYAAFSLSNEYLFY